MLIWVVAGIDFLAPPMRYEHRLALAELQRAFAGAIEVHGVEPTIESDWVISDVTEAVLAPRMRLVHLAHPERACTVDNAFTCPMP